MRDWNRFRRICEDGAFVASVDFAEKSVKRTEETFREAGLVANVLLRPADSTGLPDRFFDTAYSFGVLHHILNVESAMKEISRILKPDGVGVFMVYIKTAFSTRTRLRSFIVTRA
jgi:cyclopropane fatty-acyl-phospholipid synthase-like methyltransferase